MFSNIKDLLNYYIEKTNYFLFLTFFPLEFFEKITFKMGSSFWFLDQNIFILFFKFILRLGEPQIACFCLIPKIDPP